MEVRNKQRQKVKISCLPIALRRICKRVIPEPVIAALRSAKKAECTLAMKLLPRRMNYYCPCCGMRFHSFETASFLQSGMFNPVRYEKTNQRVFCPICRSMPRHRILALWCEEHKDYLQSSDILYFAPEKSMNLWLKRNHVACTTADLLSSADLKLDIQSTGLPDESFDVIIANHVLEHVDDFRAALKEAHRILRQNGCFICSFPMDPSIEWLDEEEEPLTAEERLQRFGQNDHKRVFGMKADRFLTEAGFDVEKIEGKDYPEEILPVVGPADYDMNILFCCRKHQTERTIADKEM